MCHNTTFAQIIVTFEAPCYSVCLFIFASGAPRDLIPVNEIDRVIGQQTSDPLTGQYGVLVTDGACDFVGMILDLFQTGLTKRVEARQYFRCREGIVADRTPIRGGYRAGSRSRTGTGPVFERAQRSELPLVRRNVRSERVLIGYQRSQRIVNVI